MIFYAFRNAKKPPGAQFSAVLGRPFESGDKSVVEYLHCHNNSWIEHPAQGTEYNNWIILQRHIFGYLNIFIKISQHNNSNS